MEHEDGESFSILALHTQDYYGGEYRIRTDDPLTASQVL